MEKEEIKERIEKGWIKARMYIEIMAADRDLAEKSLKEHVQKMKKIKDSVILKEKYEEINEVKNPPRNLEKAFSQVVQLELIAKDVETLLFIVIYFAPSAVEILEPKELKVGIQTIQSIMNSVADVMHRLAAGAGGIIIATKR